MLYENVLLARFIERPNRFIAHCRLEESGEEVVVHVKNTGRGKEVLLPEALVSLQHNPSPKRKTAYDLIAVKKEAQWINIDSQIPNALAADGIRSGLIQLPGLLGQITYLKREVTYGDSKFDIYFETDANEKGFVEVKGMTLENQQIGAFPDAPTLRGKKHVLELAVARNAGYRSYLLFIAQFEGVKVATVHRKMQPDFYDAVVAAEEDGVPVLAYNCHVTANEITLKGQVPFEAAHAFVDPVNYQKEKGASS